MHKVELTRKHLDRITAALEDHTANSYADVSVRADYSGRGMFGRLARAAGLVAE